MKKALVTGASTGIGRACATELSKAGYEVGLVARNKTQLEETKNLVENVNGKAHIFECDLSDLAHVNKLIAEVLKWTDSLDLIANIAGIWHGVDEVYAGVDFAKLEQKTILDTYMVGFTTPTLLVHGLLSIMKKGSAIVNLSGTFEYGVWGGVPYFTSKRALEDLTVGLAQELKESGIRVMCVSPADTATQEYTKFFPEDSVGANDPVEVAKMVVQMAEEGENGKFVMIRKGVLVENGYHK